MVKQIKIKKIGSLILIRRLSVWLLCCLFFANQSISVFASVYAQETKLSVRIQDKPLVEVLNAIKTQSEFSFVVNTIEVDLTRIVNVNMQQKSVEDILKEALKNTPIAYEIDGKHIYLFTKSNPVEYIQQQVEKITVKGVVYDDGGFPLPGVNVIEKGTTNGTTTDIDGAYQIRVSGKEAVLIYTYIGFSPKEMTVGDKKTIDVTLMENVLLIEEVVVVGYGTQKKESIVGSIVHATNEELQRSGNVTDLKQALTGRLPGVTTTLSTGEPGGFGDGESTTSIFIRGRNSWNNSQPLILVDGVERNMDNVDVSEVENISVLKDASATAVFGVKGANGVILITTKRGKVAKPEISLAYDATALAVSKLPNKLDSYDALAIRNQSILRDVSLDNSLWNYYTPDEILRRYRERDYENWKYIYPNVNWADALFRDVGWSQKASMNIRGGTDFVKYFGSLSYMHEGDMFNTDYDNHKGYDPSYAFNRFNFRSNFDFTLTKTTSLKVNLAGYYSKKDANYSYHYTGTGSSTNPYLWGAAYSLGPDLFYPQYPDGTWGGAIGAAESTQNPVAFAYNLGIYERKTTNLNADFAVEQKLDFITKGLSAGFSFYYDNSVMSVGGLDDAANHVRPEVGSNTPATFYFPDAYTGPDQDPSEYTQRANVAPSADFDWIITPWRLNAESMSSGNIIRRMKYQGQLNYSRLFMDKHNVGALALFTREEYAKGSMFPSYREDWVFRLTYDYASRYFFESNGAYNGSEKFSSDYRFDFFPSFALGWYLSNEPFFKVPFINRLKFRFSLGWVGDDAGTGARWIYMPGYSYSLNAHLQQQTSPTSPYTIYRQTVVPNPDIHWEKAKKTNFGVELGLLKELVTVNFDYFLENRTDIMISGGSRAIPPYFGATPPAANLGKVDAKGFELEVGINKHTQYGFDYWASLAVTHTKNEVIFRDDPLLQPNYLKAQGYSIGQTKAQVRKDIYQNWDQIYASVPQQTNDQNKIPGFYNIVDFDGDGYITSSGDNIPYGYPDVPENTYNLTLGASYKGVSITAQFYGVNNVTRQVPLQIFPNDMNTVYDHALDYWSKDNPTASSFLPRFHTSGSFYGNYFHYDGSYIRLKTAEIAYKFKKPVLDWLGVSSLRVFVNGNNLWFWSRLPDDRENHWSGGGSSAGAYPTLKRFNFGLNVTF